RRLRDAVLARDLGEELAAPELREAAADVRLEQHDHAEDERVRQEVAEEPVERDEVRPLRGEVADPQQEEPDEDVDRARAPDEQEDAVDEVADDGDVDEGE